VPPGPSDMRQTLNIPRSPSLSTGACLRTLPTSAQATATRNQAVAQLGQAAARRTRSCRRCR
jgi:hypothetical protein